MKRIIVCAFAGLAAVSLGLVLIYCGGDDGCNPDCSGIVCGLDPVCGESCGTCPAGETCSAEGQCEEDCIPDCDDRCCGDDDCGGTCLNTCMPRNPCDEATCRCERPTGHLGDPCPGGDQDCGEEWPTCLSNDFSTYCTRSCAYDSECGGDNCCHSTSSGQKFCFAPADCHGSAQVGEPCPYGNVNADEDDCAADLTCLGFAADGGNGFCPSGSDSECTQQPEQWNPDCAFGKCGASFCVRECGHFRSCPDGYFDNDVSGTCYCIPDREGSAMCTNPVENIGCPEGQMCVPIGGRFLQCVAEGDLEPGQECGSGLGSCQAGSMCATSGGESTCMKICDHDNDTGCDPDDICVGLESIDRWGVCLVIPTCQMENLGVDCPGDEVCIPLDAADGCTDIQCYPTEGMQEDESCDFLNSCAKGLLCMSGNVCKKVCVLPDGNECDAGQICLQVTGCPDTWGVCF